MMKKNLFKVVAVLAAVALCSFSVFQPKQKKSPNSVTVVFIGSVYSSFDVTRPYNWVEASFPPGDCVGPVKACSMEVDVNIMTGGTPNSIDPTMISMISTGSPTTGYRPLPVSGVWSVQNKW